MADAPAAARFVRALAATVLRGGYAATHGAEARAALDEVFRAQKSLVLDVQFTGFSQKGALVGGVDPVLLRAAGHLIPLRVARIGFTPAATAAELESVFVALARTTGELGEAGIVGAIGEIAPRGVYLSTTAGGVYRPAPRAAVPPAPEAPSADAASSPPDPSAGSAPSAARPVDAATPVSAAAAWDDDVEQTELAEFEILDTASDEGPGAPSQDAAPASPAGGQGGGGGREEPPSSDMYHFFRASSAGPDDAAEALPRLLREAENVTRFDELADAAARTALALVRSDAHAQAVELLDALVREAERADRNRFFRESAVQALRRAGTPDTLHRLVELLPLGGPGRERILRFFLFMGADALVLLEGLLHRAADAELRTAVFRALLSAEGQGDRLIAHAVQDPGPGKTRTLLELAGQPGIDPELARRWAAEAAAHRDAAVRVEAARSTAALGGRGALRVLVDLLGDPERLVRREAVHGLGTLGEAAAVPFLARLLGDSDEELQCMAAAALGRIGSQEALPPLLSVVNKRSLLQLKKLTRPKLAALQAISRLNTPAARDALQSVASGRDDLADEAKRLLAGM